MKKLTNFSKTLRVLVVEDNKESREQITKLLNNFFDDIIVAIDGIDGLEKFNTYSCDLILSDINMPNMNGIKMITKIREVNKEVPVIFLSAYNDAEYLMDAIKLSISGYILKPIDLTQFIATLGDTVENIELKTQNLQYKKELKEINKNLEQRVKDEVEINQKQNQQMIYQSRQAQMGEMLENIAHQWRQPLSVIAAASTGIKFKNELKVLKEEDINVAMIHINDSIKHLSHTIDDFRDFFKRDKKKFEFKAKDTFEKTFKLITSQFKTANITIIKDIEDVTLIGFENELIQVLINILNNARDELIKKEDLEKLILINVVKKDTRLEIYIKDNAGGIPKNIINDIFKPHFTTKEETNGTGIGLYMSQMIIKEHMNGTLEVSNVDFIYKDTSYLGAEFKISLPLKS